MRKEAGFSAPREAKTEQLSLLSDLSSWAHGWDTQGVFTKAAGGRLGVLWLSVHCCIHCQSTWVPVVASLLIQPAAYPSTPGRRQHCPIVWVPDIQGCSWIFRILTLSLAHSQLTHTFGVLLVGERVLSVYTSSFFCLSNTQKQQQ